MKMTHRLAVLILAATGTVASGASAPVPQSGDQACLLAVSTAVSCLDPGLYARARDMAELSNSASPKASAARRELESLYLKGSCAPNQAVSAAAGGHVRVIKRAYSARSKSDDVLSRQLEDEALSSLLVASYKAPSKFKGVEFYTASAHLGVCK